MSASVPAVERSRERLTCGSASAGMLRGLTDVKVPTVITFIAYWVLSLPIAYGLAFHTSLGPLGVWTGLAAGLSCAAVLLAWRFHRLTRPARL